MSSPARTTEARIIAVLTGGGDYDTVAAPDIAIYLETASALVDMVVECAARKHRTITAVQLELLEAWLGAHAYAVSDKPYSQRQTLRASGTFHGQTGMHLEATLYGQTAMDIDPSGCLNNINSRSTAYAFWGGKPWADSLSWWERNPSGIE